jgi:hypothetical protein
MHSHISETGTIPTISVARPIAMPLQEKPLEQVYCDQCHLATPVWRTRCIHCLQPWRARRHGHAAVEITKRKVA